MSPITRLAFAGGPSEQLPPPPLASSLANYVTSDDPFSTETEGTVWSWLFMPQSGTLVDTCGAKHAANFMQSIHRVLMMISLPTRVESLLDVLIPTIGVDQLGRKRNGLRAFKGWLITFGSRIIAYLKEADLWKVKIQRGIKLSLEMMMQPIDFDGFCKSQMKQSNADARDALCKQMKQAELTGTELGVQTPPHLAVVHAFGAIKDAISTRMPEIENEKIGINVVGYLHGAFGVGTAARLLHQCLASQPNIDPVGFVVPALGQSQDPDLAVGLKIAPALAHSISVTVINADMTSLMYETMQMACKRNTYWIGNWACAPINLGFELNPKPQTLTGRGRISSCVFPFHDRSPHLCTLCVSGELEEYPHEMASAAMGLDEIWTPSDFVTKAVLNLLSTNRLTG